MVRQAEPWDKPNPRTKARKSSKHLGPKQKATAKASARKEGRSRPSLVDNMNALKTSRGKSAAKKGAAKKSTTKKTAGKPVKKAAKKTTAKKRAPAKKTVRKTAKKTATKKTTRNTASKRSTSGSASRKTKDAHGGLTAEGRKMFEEKQGAHLRPGVTKARSKMTPDELRRWGSWAVRFYGRKELPPLVDENGAPTRHALSAHAWGEPVPKTEAAARKIAERGRKALEKYKAMKARD